MSNKLKLNLFCFSFSKRFGFTKISETPCKLYELNYFEVINIFIK